MGTVIYLTTLDLFSLLKDCRRFICFFFLSVFFSQLIIVGQATQTKLIKLNLFLVGLIQKVVNKKLRLIVELGGSREYISKYEIIFLGDCNCNRVHRAKSLSFVVIKKDLCIVSTN